MNLENIQAVKVRIEEIRRRFVDGSEDRDLLRVRSYGSKFNDVFSRAQRTALVACPEDLKPVIAAAARKYGVDEAVIKSVISAESGFRPTAVSRVGAQGLMQLMPGTARALGVDANDPVQNIDGGVRYLRQQLDRFGRLDLALAAYNAGPGSVIRYGGVPPFVETQRYISSVMENIKDYSEGEQ